MYAKLAHELGRINADANLLLRVTDDTMAAVSDLEGAEDPRDRRYMIESAERYLNHVRSLLADIEATAHEADRVLSVLKGAIGETGGAK